MKQAADQAKPRVAIYARLSKDRGKLSINTGIQLQECREFAADENLDVVAEFEETDISASKYSKKPRPKYRQLVELIKTDKIDGVLATEQERLQRKPDEMSELINLAGETSLNYVWFTNDDSFNLRDADGIWRARGAVANAERESNKTSKRQRRKKLAQAKEGKPGGGRRPFGYMADMVTIYEPEAVVYRRMATEFKGGKSTRTIAYELNQDGYLTTTGKLFTALTVRNLLIKPRYMGVREHYGVQYPAVWEGIISRQDFEHIQILMKSRSDERAHYARPRRFTLTGLLQCECGNRMTGEWRQDGPDRPRYRIYSCRIDGHTKRRVGCTARISAEPLEHFIFESIIFRLDSLQMAEQLEDARDDGQLTEALTQQQRQQERADQLVDDYATGLLTATQFARASRTAQDELTRLKSEIASLTRSQTASGLVSAGQTVRQAIAEHDNDWRRELARSLMNSIVISRSNRRPLITIDGKKYRFNKERVTINWIDQEAI